MSESVEAPRRGSSVPLAAAVGLSLAVFAADLITPLGYATGVLHLVPLLALLWSRVGWHVFAVAAAASLFTVLDIALGAPGEAMELVIVNRGLTLGALWTVATLLAAHMRAQQAQAAAAEQRARVVNAMLESAPDGMLLVNLAGVIKRANPAAEHIFDYLPGELVNLPVSQLVPAEHREAHSRQVAGFHAHARARAMAPGRAIQGVKKTGRPVPLEITLGHLDNGEPLAIVAVRDITDKHRIEERLRSTQRMEAIGKLAGGVAHDFNNMLAAIVCNGRLAQDALPPGSPVREDVSEILLAADRAADLTRQLLAFSRRQIISPRNVDLNDVVQQTHKMLSRLLGADVQQQLHLAPDLGTVRVDPSQLEQVLLNLTVNARDAMPKGGTLTFETSNVTLDASYCSEHPEVDPGDYVLLAVTDTGHGMSPEVRVRIFEPFFTTKPTGVGTGLGLATVYGVVKQAAGHIWVYSEVGKGTTFRVYLPRTRDPAEAVRLPREVVKPAGGAEVVLIVEDEPSLRRILVRTLRGAGYTVLEATNGEDALLKLQSWPGPLDLLLTDVVMPQMGGAELARRLHATRPQVPVLFASGYTENAIVHEGSLDPGVVFLQKPFTPDEVLRRVRQILDQSRPTTS
jgi:two-component system, cell cycle sensor histidine kinase and response regulator CckA